MRRYVGIAVGLGLVLVVLSATNAGPAFAQGALKPIMAFIVNDSSNPVPVRVVAPQATVICTASLGSISLGAPIQGGSMGTSDANFVCPDGVTKIDVARVAYTPDLGSFNSVNIVHYRVTVTHVPTTDPSDPTGQDILAVLTDGTPEAATMRPFLFDKASGGAIRNRVVASSGLEDRAVTLSGSIILIGTPVQ